MGSEARRLRTAIVRCMKARQYARVVTALADLEGRLAEVRGDMQVNVNMYPLKAVTLAQWQAKLDAVREQVKADAEAVRGLVEDIKREVLASRARETGRRVVVG